MKKGLLSLILVFSLCIAFVPIIEKPAEAYSYNATTMPSVPTGLTATQAGIKTARISWDFAYEATSYDVQYYNSIDAEWIADLDYKDKSAISYISTGLGSVKHLQYRVRAVNYAGVSDWAYITYNKPSAMLPSVPTGLTATQAGIKTARISWDFAYEATSYEVEYYDSSEAGWIADPDYKDKTAISYISTGLGSVKHLRYRVRALNPAGVSGWAYVIYSKPLAMLPSVPTGLTATQASSNTARISWDFAYEATSYEVEYYRPSSSEWRTDPDYKDKTATSYISTGLGNVQSLQYRVRAVNSAGTSDWAYFTYYK